MAIALPAIALAYLLNKDSRESGLQAARDGREHLPKEVGGQQLRDKNYLNAVRRPNFYAGPNASVDQLRGVIINRPVSKEDQLVRQNVVYEVIRSGGNGSGGTGRSALLRSKWMNARALQMNRRVKTQPGLTTYYPGYGVPEAPNLHEEKGIPDLPEKYSGGYRPPGPCTVYGRQSY